MELAAKQREMPSIVRISTGYPERILLKYLIAIERITCDNGRVFKHDPGLPGVKEEISSSERKGCREMV